ncbi:MAG: sensor histidine kinase, partial [Thiotrichaceae bacterium]|nr:sensor histidine kinase [Thiotrichaceae bacterium]
MLLRIKILLVLVPLVILPLLGVGWIAFDKLKSTHEHAVFHQMNTLLNQVEVSVDSHKTTALANIELFAGSNLLKTYLFTPASERYVFGLLPVMKLFASYNQAYPDYYEIRLLLLDGYEDARFTPDDLPNKFEDESETDYFKRLQANSSATNFSEYLKNPDDNKTVLFVAKPLYFIDPIHEDSTATKPSLRGYFAITITLDFMQQQADSIHIGNNGYLFFTDANGRIVFGSGTFPAGFELPPKLFNALRKQPDIQQLSEINNQNFIFQARQLDDNLMLFAGLPQQELLNEAQSLGLIVIGILLIAIFITVALLFAVLNYFVIIPLKELGKAAESIEAGAFDIDLNGYRKDEIGLLARQFQTMAKSLYESQKQTDQAQYNLQMFNQELEQHVQQRTLELESVNEDLMQLNQEKNEFLGIAAHDLKNPLQAIQGSAELITMMSDDDDTELLEFANMISESSERMFALITNLLDVNAIESGKIQIHVEDVNILPLLQRVVNEYTHKAQLKNIVVNFNAQQALYLARVDESTAYQILDNLISNAVKYSPFDKQIHIQIKQQIGKIRVEIHDEGAGLSKEDHAQLFGKFTRLSTRPTGDE